MLLKNCPGCSTPSPIQYIQCGPHEGVLAEYVVDLQAPVDVCECRRCGLVMPVAAWQSDYVAGRFTVVQVAA